MTQPANLHRCAVWDGGSFARQPAANEIVA